MLLNVTQYDMLHCTTGQHWRSTQCRHCNVAASTHHSPPEGVSIAAKLSATIVSNVILLCEVDKVRREDKAEKSDVQRCNQLLYTVPSAYSLILIQLSLSALEADAAMRYRNPRLTLTLTYLQLAYLQLAM